MIVNAAHMKALPGRKTDVKDAEWIADLLRHGLLKASYIPNREQRELREITRYRKSLTEERCREVNRLQKILEGANIKLDCSSLSSWHFISNSLMLMVFSFRGGGWLLKSFLSRFPRVSDGVAPRNGSG